MNLPMAGQGRSVVAIHQPNFFPWLGYFDKIARADVFVLLDHVQFPKSRPGSWLNRVQLVVGGKPTWVTMPVSRAYEGLRRIDEMKLDNSAPWRRKLLQTLRSSYGRAPHFRDVEPVITALVENPTDDFTAYNTSAIYAICDGLGIPTSHIVKSSTLDVEGGKTDLLVAIVQKVGGSVYMAGGGAGGYQDDQLFAAAGLSVEYQAFKHPVYPQHGTESFAPGQSVLDALFNCGFDGAGQLLRQPAEPAGDAS